MGNTKERAQVIKTFSEQYNIPEENLLIYLEIYEAVKSFMTEDNFVMKRREDAFLKIRKILAPFRKDNLISNEDMSKVLLTFYGAVKIPNEEHDIFISKVIRPRPDMTKVYIGKRKGKPEDYALNFLILALREELRNNKARNRFIPIGDFLDKMNIVDSAKDTSPVSYEWNLRGRNLDGNFLEVYVARVKQYCEAKGKPFLSAIPKKPQGYLKDLLTKLNLK